MSRIPEYLQLKIKEIPECVGVYFMKDRHGGIMYVGKSKSLRSRVRSYFSSHGRGDKIEMMVRNIHDIDYITTDTHLEAQILECALIKKLKPQYNSQFKNHSRYVYVKLVEDVRRKPLSIVHEREAGTCYGPYRSRRLIGDFIESFLNLYPIVKRDEYYEFQYHIFPVRMEREMFLENRRNLEDVFSEDKSMASFIEALSQKMDEACLEQKFELAALYRDVIQAVKYINCNNLADSDKRSTRKTLMIEAIDKGYKLFYIVNGRIIAKLRQAELDESILLGFVKQADRLAGIIEWYKNEKRDIDFRNIVNVELQDTREKLVFEMEYGAVFDAEKVLNRIDGLFRKH